VSSVTGILLLYGVTAIYTNVKAMQTLSLQLKTSDAN